MRKEILKRAEEILKVGQEEAAPTWRGLLEDLKYVFEDWKEGGYSREEAEDLIHEAVDTTVPVYYSGQFGLLDDPEAWNEVALRECELVEGVNTVVGMLGVAIYEALHEVAYGILNEVYGAGEEEEI